jgi:hypothetical protein
MSSYAGATRLVKADQIRVNRHCGGASAASEAVLVSYRRYYDRISHGDSWNNRFSRYIIDFQIGVFGVISFHEMGINFQ